MFSETYFDHVSLATSFFYGYKQIVDVSMAVSLGLYSTRTPQESVLLILGVILSGCLLSLHGSWTDVFYPDESWTLLTSV